MAAVTMEPVALDLALKTAAAELRYAHSSHVVDIIDKDEHLRRLRFDMHILQDDNDELRDLLGHEESRSDQFERLVGETLARAEEAEARLSDTETILRMREQEIGSLQAEARAFHTTVAHSETFLSEKLALTRELSILRPQLEHHKAQAANTEALMAEKLELQRQLTEVQCELENAKRDVKRAMAKRRNTGVEIAQEEQVDQLKRELAKEKRARQRAEQAADASQGDGNVDEVQKELAREKRARQKAEEERDWAQENTQVEDVRKDLLQEKRARAKLEGQMEILREELEKEKEAVARVTQQPNENAEADEQLEQLRQELAREKKARTKAEKAVEKQAADFEAKAATLEEKLGLFRTKLRTTKERLKEAKAECAAAREEAEAASAAQPAKKTARATATNSKKRNAAQFDVDATTLGTPGDGPAGKRGRKAVAAVGEKSSFSITPFLNRTASVAPPSDNEESEEDDQPRKTVAVSPTQEAAVTTKQKKQPLASRDANVQVKAAPRPRKPKGTKLVLEMVSEEAEEVHNQGQENAAAVKPPTIKVQTKTTDGPDVEQAADGKKKKKPSKARKSLVDFATFNEPEEAKKVQSKKSRKLGGLGKTLFDAEEETTAPVKAMPGRSVLGGQGAVALGAGTKKFGGSKIGSSLLLTAQDGSGFQFSPLKRKRGNLDDTLRG